jgi:hypothetical protein
MNATERMAILETKVSRIETTTDRIENKLDSVIETKADKCDVDKLNSRLNSLIIFIGTALITVAGFVMSKLLGWG